ncbi:MAG: SDR family NAD(P)-dependent oxidoreductase [Microbacteriaceae bacterium]
MSSTDISRPTALITGASVGIGREFARQLAARGNDLVVVARDPERLEHTARHIASEFGVQVETIVADLTTPSGLAVVEERIGSQQKPIDILVNNAGYGLRAQFEDSPIADELHHLDLLVTVPMRLTHAALGQMLPRSSGTIINIASVAGFTPRGTYGAAKAWVLSFSQWANITYKPRGVTVTAVAPGFVHTEFHDRMKVSKASVPSFMWMTAEQLVRGGLRDVDRGKAISVPTFRYKFVVWLTRWMPSRVIAAGALRGR